MFPGKACRTADDTAGSSNDPARLNLEAATPPYDSASFARLNLALADGADRLELRASTLTSHAVVRRTLLSGWILNLAIWISDLPAWISLPLPEISWLLL